MKPCDLASLQLPNPWLPDSLVASIKKRIHAHENNT